MNGIAPLQVFLLMLLTLLLAACGSDTEPQTRIFDLNIAGGSIDDEHRTLRVDHNDEVVLRITSDQEGSFHLHGYNLEAPLMPEETASLAFTANATGKFDFEMHVGSADHEGDGHSHDSTTGLCAAELPPGTPEPSINLTAATGPEAGMLHLEVEPENFVLGTDPGRFRHACGSLASVRRWRPEGYVHSEGGHGNAQPGRARYNGNPNRHLPLRLQVPRNADGDH